WFYECSYGMQRSLAEMYLADERFTATYEREVGTGGARFVHDAILANAERADG
ncbi:TipAS antibiotic-recognition domain-containing protein, partial [Actinopolyspora alba]